METARPVLETLGVDFARIPIVTRDQVKYAKARSRPLPGGGGAPRRPHRDRLGHRRQRLGHAGRPRRAPGSASVLTLRWLRTHELSGGAYRVYDDPATS